MPTVTTMCLGDSITMGSPTFQGGWRRHLNNRAPNLNLVGRNCVDGTYGDSIGHHEGYGGYQTSHFYPAPGFAFMDAYAPYLVIITLGTNNLSGGDTVTQLNDKLEALLLNVAGKSYVGKIIACSIPPRGAGQLKITETNEFNAGFIARFTNIHTKIKPYLIFSRLNNTTHLNADELHLSETGNALAGGYLFDAVTNEGIATQQTGLTGSGRLY